MALETGDRVPDLVPSNPPDSDPKSEGAAHLRLLKTTVQGSFPNLGPDQYLGTALELNETKALADSSMQKDVSVINELLDVDTVTTPPTTDGQILVWDNTAGEWVPGIVPAPQAGNFVYTGYGGQSSGNNNRWFMSGGINSITDLVTIDNSSTQGWKLTAVKRCNVNISLFSATVAGAEGDCTALAVDNDNNLTGGNIPVADRLSFHSAERVSSVYISNGGSSVVLEIGENITAHWNNRDTRQDPDWYIRGVATEVA